MDRNCQQIEKVLINRIKNQNCNESLITLTDRHTPLCWKIYGNFSAALSNLGFSADDVLGYRFDVTYRAAKNFKFEKRTKFCTFVGLYFRYYCLNILEENQKYVNVENDTLNYFQEKSNKTDKDINKNEEDFDYIFEILSKLKDKKVLKIYKLRYNKKKSMTWSEIAKKTDQSTQGIINTHNKYLKLLRSKLESKNSLDII